MPEKDTYRERVGARIRRARLDRGLSQPKLADQIGVPPSYISNWERGINRPNDAHIEALARELQVSVEHLLWGAPLDPPPKRRRRNPGR